ncbi:Dentin sialophosphoprotein [Quillaja saponaria]|uniref:Dentin sialophosphoprotein n=1 Tax=Quillaja saponaria TaxID=32244 RepID=A0AAD7QGX1_QUISA|nr:Dentin sialophosphoprotein [Quillaja saponaria]
MISSKDEFSLSELLDLEIRWPSELEKPETNVWNEKPIWTKISLNLDGVSLDDFFTKNEPSSDAFGEHLVPDKQIDSASATSYALVGNGNLSLFENVHPSETATRSTEDEIGDSTSDWAANFQPPGLETLQEGSKSFDPFFGSMVDLTAHIDTVFGSGKDSVDVKVKDNMNPSESLDRDCFQGDIWSNSISENIDWIQEEKWQSTNDKATDDRTTGEKTDSFDAWNGFTSSTSTQDPSNNVLKQAVTQVSPSAVLTAEVNLFNSSDNWHDVNCGSFPEPDFFSGPFNSPFSSPGEKITQLEAYVSNREANVDAKGGHTGDVKGGDVSSIKSESNVDDIEMLMSQMHDLSFMLESNLSIPSKLYVQNSFQSSDRTSISRI